MPGAQVTVLKPSRSVTPARKHVLAIRARDMRHFAQEPERRLWRELAGGKLGVAFRRQVVLGNRYIADFVAPAVRLVVEVDGGIHARHRAADVRRDRDLARLGYHLLRVPAHAVMADLAAAVALVRGSVEGLRR
jgi:very-short-patch-repair endonuclease